MRAWRAAWRAPACACICYDQPTPRARRSPRAGVECAENLAALCARLAGERVIVLIAAGGRGRSRTRSGTCCRCCRPATRSSTAATATTSDSMRRALALSQQGLRYIDAGVSGGVHGLANGYCLMLGGTPKSIEIFEPFARILAPDAGARLAALRAERRGAFRQDDPQRHRVRHDAGARRRLRAARSAPGARHRPRRASPKPGATAAWCAPGCSISARTSCSEGEDLSRIAPVVADSGEGRWTALESIELGVPAPVITIALMSRFSSQGGSDYARRLLAMMRARVRRPRRAAGEDGLIAVVMGVSGAGKTTLGRRARRRARLAVPRRRRFPSAGRTSPRWPPAYALDDADRWPWLDVLNQQLQTTPDRRAGMLGAQGELSAAAHARSTAMPFRIPARQLRADSRAARRAPPSLHAGRAAARASSTRSSRLRRRSRSTRPGKCQPASPRSPRSYDPSAPLSAPGPSTPSSTARITAAAPECTSSLR